MIGRRNKALTVIAFLLVLAFLIVPPHSVIEKARLVGFAVCHQMPSRSIFLDGVQLPMCARNTGIFVGAFAGLILLLAMGKLKRVGLPPSIISFFLVVFIGVMALDGINSYLPSLFRVPSVYEPQNSLRLITGTLAGMAIAAFLLPAINYVAWSETRDSPVLENFREFALYVIVAVLIIGTILLQPDFLLIPVSLASGLGTVMLMTGVNLIVVLIALGWESKAENWRDLVLPVLLAILLSLAAIVVIGQLRLLLLGPFPLDLK